MPAESIRAVLRKNGFHVREATDAAGTRFLYGDRHQYTKLATLFTHLGLILFLVAAAVTSRLGEEQGLVVGEGESLTVQPIGTPGLLLVRRTSPSRHRALDTGLPTDFTTDLAVFQDGRQIARKTIRVNDPLSVAGYTFHQNGFGPAPALVVRDEQGRPLWDGAVPLTDAVDGLPYGVAGRARPRHRPRDAASAADRRHGRRAVLPYRVTGTNPDGSPIRQDFQPIAPAIGETATAQRRRADSVEFRTFGAFTLLIAKQDPGQGLVWIAFVSLIAGITITFYLPRRRVWTRLEPDGRLGIVWRSDRYVDVEREFGRLLDELVAARRPPIATR